MPKSKQDGQGLMEETTKIPARGVDEHWADGNINLDLRKTPLKKKKKHPINLSYINWYI